MKYVLAAVSLTLLLMPVACSDSDDPDVDGLWQLKTKQYADGTTVAVDTIYYAFMKKQHVFSHIVLSEQSLELEQAETRYGYFNFLAPNLLHIQMDRGHGVIPDFREIVYYLPTLTHRRMILEADEVRYHFIKY
jgi:hypothetical protein